MRELIDAYEAGGPRLWQACQGLDPARATTRTGPGTWSIHELVIHLADMDAIALDRMKRVIAQDDPPLLNAAEDAYIQRLYPDAQSLDDALTLFEVGRRQMARVLRKLPAETFDRAGVHDVAGRLTLRDLLVSYCDHLDHHLHFLTRKRERLGA